MELRDLDRLRQRRAVDEVEAADHFLRLGERPVGHERLAAADRDPLRCRGGLEPTADQTRAALLDLREPLQHLLWLDAELGVLLGLDQEQELHRGASLLGCIVVSTTNGPSASRHFRATIPPGAARSNASTTSRARPGPGTGPAR